MNRIVTVSLAVLLAAATATAQDHPGHGHGHGHGHGAEPSAESQPTSQPHHASDRLHHDFSDAEFWSARFDDPARDEWQLPTHVVALMDLAPGAVVADLGAGTGYFLSYLSAAVGPEGRVLALDVAQELIDHMTQRATDSGWANVEARLIPFDGPGVEPASVDAILIVDTWHHISDRAVYSARLLEALRPGGAVYVVDFTLETERGPPVQHRLAPEAVGAELAAGGLTVEVLAEELPDQYVVVGRRAE